MKRFFLALLSLELLAGASAAAAPASDDDDLLLMTVPVITAATMLAPGPLGEMQKLAGDWYFDKHWEPPEASIDEFRFYKHTAVKVDAVTYAIDGKEFLGDFAFVYVDAVAGAYHSQQKAYGVVSLWGPPDMDLGSAYVFKSTETDTPGFDCHYFTDGQGNIQNYYIGFGGTLDCDRLTKTRRFGKFKRPDAVTDPKARKAVLWEKHQANLRASRSQKGQATSDSTLKDSLQPVVNAAARQLK